LFDRFIRGRVLVNTIDAEKSGLSDRPSSTTTTPLARTSRDGPRQGRPSARARKVAPLKFGIATTFFGAESFRGDARPPKRKNLELRKKKAIRRFHQNDLGSILPDYLINYHNIFNCYVHNNI
jgi:hypothetical protein